MIPSAGSVFFNLHGQHFWDSFSYFNLGGIAWRGRGRCHRWLPAATAFERGRHSAGSRSSASGAERYRHATQGGGYLQNPLRRFSRGHARHADLDHGAEHRRASRGLHGNGDALPAVPRRFHLPVEIRRSQLGRRRALFRARDYRPRGGRGRRKKNPPIPLSRHRNSRLGVPHPRHRIPRRCELGDPRRHRIQCRPLPRPRRRRNDDRPHQKNPQRGQQRRRINRCRRAWNACRPRRACL